MRIISILVLFIQVFLIVSISIINYKFHHSDTEKWIRYGEDIMRYQTIPIIFLIVSFFIGIFIKEKWWTKIAIMFFAIAGFIIFDKLWLYPW